MCFVCVHIELVQDELYYKKMGHILIDMVLNYLKK